MRTSTVSFSISTVPLLLLALAPLSSAWAGAPNSGIASPSRRRHHVPPTAATAGGSFLMKSSPSPPRGPASPSLASLLFLRGGQQQDEDTVTSDETASVDYGAVVRDAPDADAESGAPGSGPATATAPPPPSSAPLLAMLTPATAALRAASACYVAQLARHPIATKSLTAGVIFGLSDFCAQRIERGGASADDDGAPLALSRILTSFLVGLVFFGPAAHLWYDAVFRFLPSTSLVGTLQKAALGQIFFGPAFNCVFFGAGLVRTGAFSLGAWGRKIRADLPGVWASGLGFWPLVDFVSFKVVPVHWIPLFVNFCSFVWTIYLSLVVNQVKGTEAEE